jgi:hypothetical protein
MSEKVTRGNASQFFVAGELCRRGYAAVVTMGNTPNTDVLCSNTEGTRFVHIQVKTYRPGDRTCTVGMKALKSFGQNFFWVLVGLPKTANNVAVEYFIIPAADLAKNVAAAHEKWLKTPGQKGQPHKDNTIRTVILPPHKSPSGWDVTGYRNRWDLIQTKLD